MKLYNKTKIKKHSKKGKRFYTSVDMAVVKHDIVVRNSKIKRGEIKDNPNNFIVNCDCGMEGCFIHYSRENI